MKEKLEQQEKNVLVLRLPPAVEGKGDPLYDLLHEFDEYEERDFQVDEEEDAKEMVQLFSPPSFNVELILSQTILLEENLKRISFFLSEIKGILPPRRR